MASDTEVIMTAPPVRALPPPASVFVSVSSMLTYTTASVQDPQRPNAFIRPSQAYAFTKVFEPETNQPQYFAATALPLVQNLLNGENGLVFAYGVTNSGKRSVLCCQITLSKPRSCPTPRFRHSYTIQGGADADGTGHDRGVIPRAVDVVFNSIEGKLSTANVSLARTLFLVARS